jgi:hypothetical protein
MSPKRSRYAQRIDYPWNSAFQSSACDRSPPDEVLVHQPSKDKVGSARKLHVNSLLKFLHRFRRVLELRLPAWDHDSHFDAEPNRHKFSGLDAIAMTLFLKNSHFFMLRPPAGGLRQPEKTRHGFVRAASILTVMYFGSVALLRSALRSAPTLWPSAASLVGAQRLSSRQGFSSTSEASRYFEGFEAIRGGIQMKRSDGHSVSALLGSCLGCVLFSAPLGFLGLWLGYGLGSLMSPKNEELLMGYLGTTEEWNGAMVGGLLGAIGGIALFIAATATRWKNAVRRFNRINFFEFADWTRNPLHLRECRLSCIASRGGMV